ncbi:hypothetical protein BX661DRAFT_158946 [Kickxella alabastrina]|uniref:uncharacterized protein n=1 Tax=Kickxella alabastrina TaxID=61397 RepID=UPI00221F35F2|nr:uncharacterized protein BX661DRAFT_158946 [Kickxella alabastrina]KAI7834709.1 hypothetical protein BX661DRAFT_158946 [Kickxella alabastrina]KAJ1946895.1 hypothetical protein GGF37_000845 [Kickxella alabastrina]
MEPSNSGINTRIILREYASKGVNSTSCFSIDRSQPVHSVDSLSEGQVLVKTFALSVDPHLRIYISAPEGSSGFNSPSEQHPLGEPMASIGVGTVIASRSVLFKTGDHVRSMTMPWQSFSVVADYSLIKLPQKEDVPLLSYLGMLGMPAFTAYLGIITIGKAKARETVLVSAASGAVGQIVVQLAKIHGLHVIGLAGSDEKTAFVKSIGADAVINYKACDNLDAAIRQVIPQGIDIYFDSVGGSILDAAILNLNAYARVILCGSMSSFGADKSLTEGVKNLDALITKEVTMKGVLYSLHSGTQDEIEFFQEMSQLVEQEKITFKVDERSGLESAPQALVDLYAGKNFGKVVVKVE